MKKYELSEFKEKLVTEMNSFLKKSGCGYQAVLKLSPVNGVEREIILFEELSNEMSEDILGTCYLDDIERMYFCYMSGVPVLEMADVFVRKFLNNMPTHHMIREQLESLTQKDVLENISVRLFHGDMCSQNGFSYVRTWNDLSVALDVRLDCIRGRLLLTDEIFERFELSRDKAFDAAIENVKAEEYALLDSQAVCKWLSEHGVEISDTEFHKMYLYTNAEMQFGTKMIFNKQPLRKLAEKLDSDLYLCASSVHEWIVVSAKEVPVSKLMDIHKFRQDNLEQKERLSNSIYIYRRDYDNIGRVSVMKLKKEV